MAWYQGNMSDDTAPAVLTALRAAEDRGYHAVIVGDNALRIVGRFGDPTLAALEVMIGTDAPLGVQADGTEGHHSAVCLWTGPDLYAVTLGEGGRWEHFRADQGLGMLRDSWRGGSRARYRLPHGPLVHPLPEAIALAESWGFETPQTHQPPVHRATSPSRATRPAASGRQGTATSRTAPAARTTRTPRPKTAAAQQAVKAEPAPKICPTCFTALPATGRCDFCS